MPTTIRKAKPSDLPGVIKLLNAVALPSDDIAEQLATFIVAENQSQLLGCAGLEVYDDAGLLRSVAVHPDHQNRGVGLQLMECILTQAKSHRIKTLYLLTTSAVSFMAKFGFQAITREQVDPRVRQSVEFKSACCESANCMKRSI